MTEKLLAARLLWPVVKPYMPTAVVRLIARLLPPSNLQKLRDIIYTMDEQSRIIYNGKKAALEKGDEAVLHQMNDGKDIMSILRECVKVAQPDDADIALVNANVKASDEDRLPEDELIAQMS